MIDEVHGPPTIDALFLWQALGNDEHQEACEVFFDSEDSQLNPIQSEVISKLASILQYRRKFLEKQPTNTKAHLLSKSVTKSALRSFIPRIIHAWLWDKHETMVNAFLERAGIQHEKGHIPKTTPIPNELEWADVFAHFGGTFGDRVFFLYAASLSIAGPTRLRESLFSFLQKTEIDFVSALRPEDGSALLDDDESASDDIPPPEDSEGFTTLDHLVINAIVACALDTDYAFTETDAEHLMDEMVGLSAERKRSHFHRGFFHAVFARDLEFSFPGENEDRRIWYLCGAIFGLLRQNREAECINVIREQREIVKSTLQNKRLPCGVMLLPHIYGMLLRFSEYALLRDWVREQVLHLAPPRRESLLRRVYNDASTLMRREQSPAAGILLELLSELLDSNTNVDPRFRNQYIPLVQRRRAQILQFDREFAEAQELLDASLKDLHGEDAANALTDLGLIKGSLPSLQSILPTHDEASRRITTGMLLLGKEHFETAIASFGTQAVNAHFCIGVLGLLEDDNDPKTTYTHLNISVEGMLRKQEAYTEGGLIDWATFLRAIALLQSLNEHQLHVAIHDLESALKSTVRFPLWLWAKALDHLQVFDVPEKVASIADALLRKRGDVALTVLQKTGLATLPSIQRPYFDWLARSTEPLEKRWPELCKLLDSAQGNGSVELGTDILDYLEEQAHANGTVREWLLETLELRSTLLPMWDDVDVAYCRCHLYELDGQWEEASRVLRPAFFQLRNAGTDHHIQEAIALVKRIKDYGLESTHWKDLEDSLPSEVAADAFDSGAEELLRNGSEKVRVLYVGGNETQQRFETEIREYINQEFPGIEVEFLFPGWGSNWNQYRDATRCRMDGKDVVVLSRMMRTSLGQSLRKMCDDVCPWYSCNSKGRDGISRGIVNAAIWHRTQSIRSS